MLNYNLHDNHTMTCAGRSALSIFTRASDSVLWSNSLDIFSAEGQFFCLLEGNKLERRISHPSHTDSLVVLLAVHSVSQPAVARE